MGYHASELPEQGIYHDVPFEDYLAWPAYSNSKISLARRSLLHLKESQPLRPTKALRFGSFVHCGVLEPLAVSERYAVMPAYELDPHNVTSNGAPSQAKTTKFYCGKRDAFLEANPGKQLILESEYQLLLTIAKRLKQNKLARDYVNGADTEVSLIWKDERSGLMCKARLDAIKDDFISDLKTCYDLSKFHNVIAERGYHRQAAHYREGWYVLTGERKQSSLVAVESSHPCPVAAAPIIEDAVELGAFELRQTLDAIAQAETTNQWTGPQEPKRWLLPEWYVGKDAPSLTVNGQVLSL